VRVLCLSVIIITLPITIIRISSNIDTVYCQRLVELLNEILLVSFLKVSVVI